MASVLSDLIWSVADLLRGDYKQSDYGKVILPFTLLRRLDCVLEPTKEAVLAALKEHKGDGELLLERALTRASKHSFYNTSRHTLATMLSDPDQVKKNLQQYVNSFSPNAQDVFARYKFAEQLDFLSAKGLLYMVLQKFASFDLRPRVVSNADMGSVFEELIRKFSELSNETAGEHFTPREVIRLMVEILFYEDSDILAKPGTIRTLYDCCAGTGGMLSVSSEYLAKLNPQATLKVYGQELNDESFAICKADMLIKGADVKNVICGNTLSEDGLSGKKFDYMLTNPPFGVEWKKVQKEVEAEHDKLGFAGRFGPGLPRVSDGSLLFLLHLLSKMRPVDEGGSRIGIVLNGSPLFTGGAGSGESDIRRYILENDYLEAIIALPTDMFYNTGIATYVWILSNHKAPKRKGKVQLINGVNLWKKMKKSLGSKRKELGEDDIETISKAFGSFKESDICRIVPNQAFGYSTITVERPLRIGYDFSPAKVIEFMGSKANADMTRLAELFEKITDDDIGMDFQQFLGLAGAGYLSQSVGKEEQASNSSILTLVLEKKLRGKYFTSRESFENFLAAALAKGKVRMVQRGYTILERHFQVQDDRAEPVPAKGKKKPMAEYEPDSSLRDTENVPLTEDIDAYFRREVLPHIPDAWIDPSKTRVGYEIPFTRYFYKYTPPRPLEEIDSDLKVKTEKIMKLLGEISG